MQQEQTNKDGCTVPGKSVPAKLSQGNKHADDPTLKKDRGGDGKPNKTESRRPSGSSKVHSWRLNERGEAALEILRNLHPEKKISPLISDTLALAVGMLHAAPTIEFASLDSASFIKVQGATAKLERDLKSFRSDLISIQMDPDATDEISMLATKLESHLDETTKLRKILAKLSLIPTLFERANPNDILSLKEYFENGKYTSDKSFFGLGRKLVKSHLP